MNRKPPSSAMRSALLAVARMKGDSDVSEADVRKAMAAALRRRPDEDDDAEDQAERRQ